MQKMKVEADDEGNSLLSTDVEDIVPRRAPWGNFGLYLGFNNDIRLQRDWIALQMNVQIK